MSKDGFRSRGRAVRRSPLKKTRATIDLRCADSIRWCYRSSPLQLRVSGAGFHAACKRGTKQQPLNRQCHSKDCAFQAVPNSIPATLGFATA